MIDNNILLSLLTEHVAACNMNHREQIPESAKEIARIALAQAKALVKDAERYRYIRQEACKSYEEEEATTTAEAMHAWGFLLEGGQEPDDMDAAFDAAIADAVIDMTNDTTKGEMK